MSTNAIGLTRCPVCQTEVSEAAYQCPKCAHTLRKPTRTVFGKVVKWAFIGYNILMLWWLIAGLKGAGDVMNKAGSEAGRAGAAIGTTMGVGLIFFFWVCGVVILGAFVMFTRPKIT
jgi:hypothetical protein